jgi:hypothetical protein
MKESSIILIIASFFIFLFVVADQIRRIKNVEVKKLLGKITDIHSLASGIFDEPPFAILGIIVASFYTLFIISKLCIQGKLGFLIREVMREKIFLQRFIFFMIFWITGTTLAYYERFIEYVLLVFIAIVAVTVVLIINKFKMPSK